MNILRQAQKIRDLERSNARLMAKLIIQQIELETIAEDPTSDKAKQIIARTARRLREKKKLSRQGKINSTMSCLY